MLFMQFLASEQLKTDMMDDFIVFLASGQLKTDFSHPLWYDLAMVDEFT